MKKIATLSFVLTGLIAPNLGAPAHAAPPPTALSCVAQLLRGGGPKTSVPEPWEIQLGQRIPLHPSADGLYLEGKASWDFALHDYTVRIEAQYTDPSLNPAAPKELIQGFAYLDHTPTRRAFTRVLTTQPINSWLVPANPAPPNLRAFETTLYNPQPQDYVLGRDHETIWDAFRAGKLPPRMAVMAKLYCYGVN